MTDRKITDELRAVENELRKFDAKWLTTVNRINKARIAWDDERKAYIDGLDDELRAKALAIGILEQAE